MRSAHSILRVKQLWLVRSFRKGSRHVLLRAWLSFVGWLKACFFYELWCYCFTCKYVEAVVWKHWSHLFVQDVNRVLHSVWRTFYVFYYTRAGLELSAVASYISCYHSHHTCSSHSFMHAKSRAGKEMKGCLDLCGIMTMRRGDERRAACAMAVCWQRPVEQGPRCPSSSLPCCACLLHTWNVEKRKHFISLTHTGRTSCLLTVGTDHPG